MFANDISKIGKVVSLLYKKKINTVKKRAKDIVIL